LAELALLPMLNIVHELQCQGIAFAWVRESDCDKGALKPSWAPTYPGL
jgi:hypothetical protein